MQKSNEHLTKLVKNHVHQPLNPPKIPFIRAHKAFTITELIVTIFSLAILFLVLTPGLRHAQDRSKQIICAAHLRTVGAAFNLYLNDNLDRSSRAPNWIFWNNQWTIDYFGDPLPYYEYQPEHIQVYDPSLTVSGYNPYQNAYWGVAYRDYIESPKAFHCPSKIMIDDYREVGDPFGTPMQPYLDNSCYGFNSYLESKILTTVPNPSQTILTHDHIETRIEGSNDMFYSYQGNINLSQWRGTGPAGMWPYDFAVRECFRHHGQSNTLWLDGHVSPINETFGEDVPQIWYYPFE
ncbi:MAG: hypothetical protein JXD22_04610 [Sedimentisphaerales bacterium]|nr:hypothetical protein [Sedimentisphaerales bacterium]